MNKTEKIKEVSEEAENMVRREKLRTAGLLHSDKQKNLDGRFMTSFHNI